MEMVNRSIEVTYQCPDCHFKLTKTAKFNNNIDVSDRLAQNADSESCIVCNKEMGIPSFIKCGIAKVSNDYYRFEWKCKDCDTLWYSNENTLKPADANYHLKRASLKMCCINDSCKSTNFIRVSFQRIITRRCSSEE